MLKSLQRLLTRNQVLEANQRIRSGNSPLPTRLDDGYVALRIPKRDWPILRKWDPELESHDHEIRLKAWKRLEAGPLGELYRVTARSPSQVKRSTRHGNRGIIVR